VFPYDFMDQPGNAARVVHHRLGLRGDRSRATPIDIRSSVESLLSTGFTPEAQSMQRAMESARSDLAQNLEAIITDLGSSGRTETT